MSQTLGNYYYWPLVMNVVALSLMVIAFKIRSKQKSVAGCFSFGVLTMSIITGLLSTGATINYFFAHIGLDRGAMAYSIYVLLFLPCAIINFLFSVTTKDAKDNVV